LPAVRAPPLRFAHRVGSIRERASEFG